jgi:hypothetical protein
MAVARKDSKWDELRHWRRAGDLNSEERKQLNNGIAIGTAQQGQLEYD